jgi:2-octaprenyl-6-methoxyphenol hydroxylase
MNICIIGDNLTSLSLAKNLVNKKINIHVYHKDKIKNLLSNRTIGISKSNLEFFKKEIYNIPKNIFWEINKIEIYSEKLDQEKLLDFKNNKKKLFYMVRNNDLYESLQNDISRNIFFKRKIIKNNFNYEEILKKNKYDLIINCDSSNYLSKKYFTKKINKDYKNLAYTTILKHKKIENNVATQIFTKFGPIAFLPISNVETSIVYSLDTKNRKYNDNEILDLIL